MTECGGNPTRAGELLQMGRSDDDECDLLHEWLTETKMIALAMTSFARSVL